MRQSESTYTWLTSNDVLWRELNVKRYIKKEGLKSEEVHKEGIKYLYLSISRWWVFCESQVLDNLLWCN